MWKKIIPLVCGAFLPHFVSAQLTNTGEKIFIGKDAVVFVQGDLKHKSGSVLAEGNLVVNGNWTNDDANSAVFKSGSTGTVFLKGADQTIGGANATSFPGLELLGTGVKKLAANAEVTGTLKLGDRELRADQFQLTVSNTASTAIERSTGFISTDAKGQLIRSMTATASYTFPLGSVSNSQLVYRPLIIESQGGSNAYAATFFNEDPSVIGYDRKSKRPDIDKIFEKYFFEVSQTAGTGQSIIKFMQNTTVDGDVKDLANWNSVRLWERTASISTDGNFGDGLDRSLAYTANTSLKKGVFTFANATEIIDPLTIFNAFSPDGDG